MQELHISHCDISTLRRAGTGEARVWELRIFSAELLVAFGGSIRLGIQHDVVPLFSSLCVLQMGTGRKWLGGTLR